MRDIEKYEAKYLEQNFEDYQVLYRRKKVLEVMGQYPHRNILEIGCGMNPFFTALSSGDYDTMTLVEPGEVFCRHALQLRDSSDAKEKITCVQGFLEDSLELLKGKYDFILCSGLLHEVEDSGKLLSSIRELCLRQKDTAAVHINVPNARSLHRLIAKEMGILKDEYGMSERNQTLQQHRVYDLERLEAQVKAAGFSIMESGSFFLKPFAHSQMYDLLQQGIIEEKVLDGLYGAEKYIPGFGSEIYVNCTALS